MAEEASLSGRIILPLNHLEWLEVGKRGGLVRIGLAPYIRRRIDRIIQAVKNAAIAEKLT